MKIACISLGCPKNQVDLDVMVHILLSAGHETVADLAEADVILVNTCGFIESAKTEAIENILEACSYKQQNPELKVIVTGCLAERYRSQIEEEIPEVDAVVGCASNKAIDTIVARLFHGEDHLESYGAKKDFPLGGKRVIGTPAHYAYLKIAEGCNNRCHYCAIPGIRGPLHSRDMADCVAEARWLAGEGVKELIVVAQDPTAYGEDWGKPGSICELLDKLNKVPGLEWIRIMYAYPERITDEFIAAMKRNEKVVPYLDLPIQHCNDTILKNMNRRSTRAELLEVIGKLRREMEARWEVLCQAAADAAAKEGTLELPRSYTIHSGVPVGKWLELQRQVQAGQRPGRLTAEQAAKLEKLGIRWNHRLEAAWEKGFASAQKYRTEHGDLLVPVRYRDKNDFALGEWIVYNRQRYLGGNLTQNRIERLEAIGMVWSTSNDLWEQNYAAATQYYLEHGDLEVPIKYETPSGFGLGVWLGAQRAAHKAGELPQEQLERLDALGMDWTNRNDRKWMSLYDVAAAYYHEHGNLNVPSEYVTPDGVLLGKWVARQRYAYLNPDRSSARVTPERKALLDKLGMVWEKYDPWQERYDLALAYKTEHGDLEIPSVYKTADGVWLGSWVNRQRQTLNSGSSALSSERRKLLRTLFKGERRPSDPAADHGTVREANWERNFRSAARYARKYKHLLVPASYVDSDGVRLGVWISNLRAARKNRPDSYQVTPAHIKKLNSIGMVWDARDAKWGTAYQQAKAYYKAHGNLHAAANYKSDETGFCLGDWLRRMREWDTTHDPKLTPERRAMLDKIGMEWSE